jgi:hypothetical protein
LEEVEKAVDTWKPNKVLERKREILRNTGPIVISSSDIISPI